MKRKVILTIPNALVEEPVTYNLIKKYDVMVNILKAAIRPKESGRMVVELSGKKRNMERGFKYLQGLGVTIEPLAQEIRHLSERCVHCSACVPHCPTGALSLNKATMEVSFQGDKCILCESCVLACPYRAIEIHF